MVGNFDFHRMPSKTSWDEGQAKLQSEHEAFLEFRNIEGILVVMAKLNDLRT